MSKFLIYRDEQVRYICRSGRLYSFKRNENRVAIPVEVDDNDAEEMLNTGKFMVHEKSFMEPAKPKVKRKRRAYARKVKSTFNELNY